MAKKPAKRPFKKAPAPAAKAKAGKRPGVPMVGPATAKNTGTKKPAPSAGKKDKGVNKKGFKKLRTGKSGY